MKKIINFAVLLTAVIVMTITSFAGTRIDGTQGQWKRNEIGWWWENADSSYPVNKWEWLDGNGDGVAECYYFDERGYMAANRDVGGYWVNADGAWVDMYGTVQTKVVNNGLNNMPVAQNDTNNISVSQNNVDSDNVPEMFLPNGEPNMEYRNYLQNKVYERIAIEQAEKEQKEKERQERNAAEAQKNAIEAQKNSDNDDGTSLEEKRERILNDINKYRKKAGKEPLELDDELNDYAQIRAEECEEKYSHVRPNGEYFTEEMTKLFRTASCGENIAKNYTANNVVKAWYNSAGHKRIMLGGYEKCGIGIYGDYIALDLIK